MKSKIRLLFVIALSIFLSSCAYPDYGGRRYFVWAMSRGEADYVCRSIDFEKGVAKDFVPYALLNAPLTIAEVYLPENATIELR